MEPFFYAGNQAPRRRLAACYAFFDKITASIARTGNSIKGPITKIKEITGLDGKAIIAIAKATGEFLAEVVKIKDVVSRKESPNFFPVKKDNKKTAVKKIITGKNSFAKIIRFPVIASPCEANIAATATQSNIN
jgi:hypothetical protein